MDRGKVVQYSQASGWVPYFVGLFLKGVWIRHSLLSVASLYSPVTWGFIRQIKNFSLRSFLQYAW